VRLSRLCSWDMFSLAANGFSTLISFGFGGPLSTSNTIMLWTSSRAVSVSSGDSHSFFFAQINCSLVATCTFYVAKTKFLARLQPDKEFRWDYDFLEIGNGYSPDYAFGMSDFNGDYHSEDDGWTTGSSSSVSSGCRSPVEDTQSVWESGSETLAGHSDTEGIDVVVDDRR